MLHIYDMIHIYIYTLNVSLHIWYITCAVDSINWIYNKHHIYIKYCVYIVHIQYTYTVYIYIYTLLNELHCTHNVYVSKFMYYTWYLHNLHSMYIHITYIVAV